MVPRHSLTKHPLCANTHYASSSDALTAIKFPVALGRCTTVTFVAPAGPSGRPVPRGRRSGGARRSSRSTLAHRSTFAGQSPGPAGPAGPVGPCGPGGPAGPAGSCPARKSLLSSEPFFTFGKVTAFLFSCALPTLLRGSAWMAACDGVSRPASLSGLGAESQAGGYAKARQSPAASTSSGEACARAVGSRRPSRAASTWTGSSRTRSRDARGRLTWRPARTVIRRKVSGKTPYHNADFAGDPRQWRRRASPAVSPAKPPDSESSVFIRGCKVSGAPTSTCSWP
jgi:hypothetical protein